MNKNTVYIDGSEGTTGLRIHERLSDRSDIEIIRIPEAQRRDPALRRSFINEADLVILALPDDAAREAVGFIDEGNDRTRILDSSTAHRVTDGWVYGLPELPGQRELIGKARRVANPGCHATGAIMLLRPLVDAGLVDGDFPVSIISVTGYTGGGKKMISEYETSDRKERWDLNAPRAYALSGEHKHLPEISKYARLTKSPSFVPIVADYSQGMQVIISLRGVSRSRSFETLKNAYGELPNVAVLAAADAFESSNVNADTDKITLRALGRADDAILTAQFNNLGKGAAGAAVQNMNLMLGLKEFEGCRL